MFELLTPTAAVLRSVTPRTERHGDDDVFAVSLGLTITGPNTILDALQPGLRDMIYKAVEGQEQLPGVEPSTPLLRTRGVESINLAARFDGWTLRIDAGIDESNPIALGGAKVDRFSVEPSEGGTVALSFRVGSSDIDAEEAGWICAHLKQEITITLKAPERPSDAIDGTVGHPGLAAMQDGQAEGAEAGDMFAAAHEGGPEDEEGGDSEGGEEATTRRGRRSRASSAGSLPH